MFLKFGVRQFCAQMFKKTQKPLYLFPIATPFSVGQFYLISLN